MEGNGLSERMFSNVGGGGILGLEMPLHPPQTTQNPHHHLQKHPQMMAFTLQQQQEQQQEQQTQLTMKQPNYPHSNQNPHPPQRSKTQMTQLTNSDEDEPGCANDDSSFDGKRKSSTSPWQRMKWTDSMVRLLIMAVYYIGDEAGSELGSDKKKPATGGGGGGGVLQKKGKWKSVSRAMMEKGFYVSPQQCEDKFNDLNKRYKRVNDILGKGTACRVVENQTLLDTMDISPKMKDEARKLLNSKHLFFREMCVYHNSCGHGTVGPTSDSAAAVETSNHPQHHPQQQQQQPQSCLHSSTSPPIPPQSSMVPSNSKLDDDDEDDDDDDEDDDDDDAYDEDDDEPDEGGARKKAKTNGGISSNIWQASWQQLKGEAMGILQDGSKTSWEKKQWVMTQLVQLEEQGVKFQYQGLELEKQRLKWMKFSSKKEREMERMKIDNERNRLENERMVLLLRQKEIELLVFEQHHRPSNPSCVSG